MPLLRSWEVGCDSWRPCEVWRHQYFLSCALIKQVAYMALEQPSRPRPPDRCGPCSGDCNGRTAVGPLTHCHHTTQRHRPLHPRRPAPHPFSTCFKAVLVAAWLLGTAGAISGPNYQYVSCYSCCTTVCVLVVLGKNKSRAPPCGAPVGPWGRARERCSPVTVVAARALHNTVVHAWVSGSVGLPRHMDCSC